MAWKLSNEANGPPGNGISVYDSFSAPGQIDYSATITWPLVVIPPTIVTGELTALTADYFPRVIQATSVIVPFDSGGFSTYAAPLDQATTAGNVLLIDVALTCQFVAAGFRLTDDAGNFYWPILARRLTGGGGDFLVTYMGTQAAPASWLYLAQGPGVESSKMQQISMCATEYKGITQPTPGQYQFTGVGDGADNVLYVASGDVPTWIPGCYCQITGLGLVEVGRVDASHISINGAGAIPVESYPGEVLYPPDVFTFDSQFTPLDFAEGDSVTSVAVDISLSSGNYMLHLAGASYPYYGIGSPSGGGSVGCFPAWLVINEPGSASPFTPNVWTDQSERLFLGEKIGFSWIVRQRGQATIPLIVHADDEYQPTVGSQVCLWDITEDAEYEVFSGTIDDIDWRWLDQTGYRIFTLTCVSLVQVFDTIRLPNLLFEDMAAGDIFTALFAYAAGSPVALGEVDPGMLIANFLVSDYPSIADAFTRLATLSGFIWGVDPGTGTLFFHLPDTEPSPFTINSDDVLWLSMTLKQERQDYRNRQILKVPDSLAVQSSEYFVGSGQLDFTLLRPVQSVTAAWITQNIQNAATGTLSGMPSVGDVVSFTFPTSGSGFNWSVGEYDTNAIIIDPAGYVQRNLGALGYTGNTEPIWIDIYQQVTSDGPRSGFSPGINWTNEGPAGFGNGDLADYTWVDVLDNTQFGQVLRGASVSEAIQNLADAINAVAAKAGITFSLPTWENPQVNADEPAGSSTIVVRNKPAGAGFVVSLGATGTAFTWDHPSTTGGVTTFGTISVNVGILGQTTGGGGGSGNIPTLVYTPGSPDISLATPLDSGSNLQVQYVASGANYIQVENSADVIARAEIEQGTGKYQQTSSDDQAITLPQALVLAQQELAAYGVIPSTFEFDTFQAGLYVGQVVTVDMTFPVDIGEIVNAEWFIQEIKAEVIPVQDLDMGPHFLPGPNGGHYRYTITCIDVAQIGSWIDFWLNMNSGGSGGGGTVSPGGGSLGPSGTSNGYTQGFTVVADTPLAITHALNTTAVIAQAYDSGGVSVAFGSLVVTSANVVTVTFGIGFSGTIVIMGIG